jgi:hypothetical protein
MDDSNPKVLLKDIIIDSQNTAISVMAGMLEIAQSRGTFNMEESAKIWECIKKLRGPPQQVQEKPEEKPEEKTNNVVFEVNEKSE